MSRFSTPILRAGGSALAMSLDSMCWCHQRRTSCDVMCSTSYAMLPEYAACRFCRAARKLSPSTRMRSTDAGMRAIASGVRP